MQDFVRVSVAEAAEQMRIGQSTFQRAVLSCERTREFVQRAIQNIQTAWIMGAQGDFALQEMQRRPFLGSRFGQEQRTVRETVA